MEPLNAVAAAAHANPYPYYRRLLGGPELAFDPSLALWVASRASVIGEVMANVHCHVRPTGEPVPSAIAGTSAGAVFARMVRMNEGPFHAQAKRAIIEAMAALDAASTAQRSLGLASTLARRHGVPDDAAITRWMVDLPTWVVADLLGFDEAGLPQVAQWTAAFVRCLSPLSTPQQLADASIAAQALGESIAALVENDAGHGLARRAAQLGLPDRDALIANLVGLLSQTHEATAGLIGNCIVALLNQTGMQARLRADPRLAGAFVREVARCDPPVQNTRRFVTQPTTVAGVALQPGDVILLLLAAAGGDERAHADAGTFSLERADRTLYGFGQGRHACPGQDLAFIIATSAVQYLLSLPHPLALQTLTWTYAPSVNARLPRFSTPS